MTAGGVVCVGRAFEPSPPSALRHRVVAAPGKGVATEDAPGAQHKPRQDAMFQERLRGVFAARGLEPAGRDQLRTDVPLVKPDGKHNTLADFHQNRAQEARLPTHLAKAPVNSWNEGTYPCLRCISHTSTGFGGGGISAMACRNTRLVRLRSWALPAFRDMLTPILLLAAREGATTTSITPT